MVLFVTFMMALWALVRRLACEHCEGVRLPRLPRFLMGGWLREYRRKPIGPMNEMNEGAFRVDATELGDQGPGLCTSPIILSR